VTERVRALVGGASADVVALARPAVSALAEATGETAALWLSDGDAVVAAAVAPPAVALRVVLAEGDRIPAYACAPGKAVLAARPDTEVRAAAARGFRPLTMRTVGEAEQLLVELRRARESGVAIARGEEADGVTSVAAAGRGGSVAIGIAGPSPRVEARLDELASIVIAAGEHLGRLLDRR
jgi:DNA-binding IclR family transcriptional regulator